MKKFLSAASICLLLISSAWAEEIEIRNGLITTNNVDITANDGSLLSERLQVGDKVFIIINPNDTRKGWVRISKSPDDLDGIGWVESKNVRSFSTYKKVNRPDKPRGKILRKRVVNKGSQKNVAVAPFVASSSGRAAGESVHQAFLGSLAKSGSFKLTDAPSRMDPESKASLRLIAKKMNLDGIFTGKLSDPIGGGRLLQVQFYSVEKDDFVLKKTKRIPIKGNSSAAIQGLVSEIASSL